MNRKKKIIIILSSLLLLVILAICSFSYVKGQHPIKYADIVSKYSDEYGVPRVLLYAVIKTESGFDEKAKSGAGALGLTQITPDTFKWLQSKTRERLADDELYNAETAIKYSALFYKILLDEFENTETAIAAYHAGRGKVNSWLEDKEVSPDGKTLSKIPTSDTAHYVHKVTKAISIYDMLYNKEL